MKRKIPKQSTEQNLLKKIFSKKHFEVNFLYVQILKALALYFLILCIGTSKKK